MQKVSPRTPLMASPLGTAAGINQVIDVVNAFRDGHLTRPPWDAPDDSFEGFKIRNDTGAALGLGDVVELGNYLLNKGNLYRWVFEGKAISTTLRRRYAVAAEPIQEDRIGKVWVRGPAVLHYAGSSPTAGQGFGPKPSTASMFEDVYKEMPRHLREQRQQLGV